MTRDAGTDTITAVQEKVLDAIKVGQDATLTAVREAAEAFTSAIPQVPEWAEAFTSAMPKMPEWAEAYTPTMPDFSAALPSFETLIGFTEKVWENQREFNKKLYEAIAPIGKSAFAAAKDTAKVTKPAEPPTKPTPEHTPRAAAAKS